MRSTRVALGMIAILTTGCPSTIVVDGTTVVERSWRDAEAKVTTLAKTELGCEEIRLQLLRVHPAGTPSRIAARGCEKSATYIPSGSDGWSRAKEEALPP